MTSRFHPEAVDEFEEASCFYAASEPGLEVRFIECIEAALQNIEAAPERWRIFEDDIRRCVVRVFPYVLLYSIEPDHVLIVAVMHCSRKPGYWKSRTRG